MLYSGDTEERPYDSTNFYGDISNTDPITANGYISMSINEETYYLPIYKGESTEECSSNLIGNIATEGSFTFAGHALIKYNDGESDTLMWTPVYEKN
jgi:hypothetical protein